jgi:4-amino-4-deoxy-L-arabinose transferase-like glycosyltransferase
VPTLLAQSHSAPLPSMATMVRKCAVDWPVATTVLSAFVVRFLIVLIVFRGVASPSGHNEQFGWEMGWVARSIASSHGFSSPFFPSTGGTALVPPLYPYFLAVVFRCFGIYSATSAFVVLTINSILSALTCIPIALLTRQAFGERTSALASWLWAIYPFSIYFAATRVWDYALTAFLFALCFCWAQFIHRRPTRYMCIGFGILYGVTALSNPSVLSILPLALTFIPWRIHRNGGRWLRSGLLILLGTLSVLLPWTLRNRRVLHANVPIRDGFWLECWAGNHGDLTDSNPPNAHPASNDAEMQRYLNLGEHDYLAEKRTLAIAYISGHPVEFSAVSVRRVVRFWTGFWSLNPAYRQREPLDLPNLFFCSSITALMAYGLYRSWRHSRRNILPWLGLLLVFPLPYYISHSSMDYRQPIEPEIIILVAVAFQRDKTRPPRGLSTSHDRELAASYRDQVALAYMRSSSSSQS